MKMKKINGYRYSQAIVAFGGRPTLWWMHFLKKGFYHCIIAMGNGKEWVIIDPLLHFTDLIIIKDGSVDSFFKSRGYRILNMTVSEPKKIRLRVMPYTCVETVKRFLGVENTFIFTPYSLFCYLNKKIGKKSLTLI